MFKILLALILMTGSAWSAQWRAGTGENTLTGASAAADIDTNTFNSIVTPLDSLLANYKQGIILTYDSASQITATAGSVTVSNASGAVRLMLKNTTSTTVTWADIDTGAEASGTTYYVYAIAASISSTAATFKISASSTSPSGATYYKRIGSFLNDASSNITTIDNDDRPGEYNTWSSKSIASTYQALTDGTVCGMVTTAGSGTSSYLTGYSDSSSSPTTVRGYASAIENSQADHSVTRNSFCFPVKAGDYYKIDTANWAGGSAGTNTMYYLSTN